MPSVFGRQDLANLRFEEKGVRYISLQKHCITLRNYRNLLFLLKKNRVGTTPHVFRGMSHSVNSQEIHKPARSIKFGEFTARPTNNCVLIAEYDSRRGSAQTLAVCFRSTTRKSGSQPGEQPRSSAWLHPCRHVSGESNRSDPAQVSSCGPGKREYLPHAFCVLRLTRTASHAMSFDPCTAH